MNHWSSRALLQSLDDSGALQLADFTGYAGAAYAGMHRVQHFGFSAVPPAGSHGLVLPLRGQHGLAVLLGGEFAPARPTGLNPGESQLYDQWDDSIYLTQDVMTVKHTKKIILVVGGSGGMVASITPSRINLGADPAPNAVMTTAGASSKVFSV